MKRRNFLIGAGSAAIGGSALLGSGAFSRVESHRAVTVQVAEDPDAYLGLDGCPESPNASYTSLDEHGHLQIQMNDENPTDAGGEGVNSNSITWFDNVFQICNQGKEQVCVFIAEKIGADPDRVTFYTGEQSGEDPIPAEARLDTTLENGLHLPTGECECVGMQVNTKEDETAEILKPEDGDELLEEVKLIADVSDACKETEVCAELEAEFNCVTTDVDEPTGHRIDVTNTNIGDTNFGLAILNSPDEFEDVDSRFVAGNSTVTVPGRDASFPLGGIVFFEEEEACEEIKDITPVEQWDGIETPIGIPDPDAFDFGTAPPTQQRYDEVVGIEDIDDFNEALDPAEDADEVPTEGVYVAEIDYSSLDPELDWEDEQDEFFCE